MHLDFPYRIGGDGRTAVIEDRNRHIAHLIEQVLFTAPGERVMRPEFGSGLRELLFDGNSEALATAAEFMVQSAIQGFLKELVVIEALDIVREDSTISITLTYVVRAEDERVTQTFTREF
jgi:phage baseplate assembly protein W